MNKRAVRSPVSISRRPGCPGTGHLTEAPRRTALAVAMSLGWALALGAPDASARTTVSQFGSLTEATLGHIELSAIAAGHGGFVIHGESAGDTAGYSVSSAGDVNGDGLEDLIIGAPGADPNGVQAAGKAYVVFGKASKVPVELSDVASGIGGFVMNSVVAGEFAGLSVAGAGDINGDGLADVLVYSDRNCCTNRVSAVYVVFGKTDTSAVELNASSLQNKKLGFGISGFGASENVGNVAAAGDVNGDGLADLIAETPSFFYYHRPGAAYVVFGKTDSAPVSINNITAGQGGFAIKPNGNIGERVAGAGDVNGDGLADLILGEEYDQYGTVYESYSYVVFGKTDTNAVDLREVATGAGGGFVIIGASNSSDGSGFRVAGAGDVNGDGLADLLIGAIAVTPSGGGYVVFGKTDPTPISLDDVQAGAGGFVIHGEGGGVGWQTSPAGDVNGDGLADVFIAAAGATARRSYVVFGKTETSAVELSDVVAGNGGIAIFGEDAAGFAGNSISGAGDVNGDGLADLIVGDRFVGGIGRGYVIFGSTSGAFGKSEVDQLGGSADDTLTGTYRSDVLVGGRGGDTLLGKGGGDVLYGGRGDDNFVINASNVKSLGSPFGIRGNSAHLSRIDGGPGYDTLVFSGGGVTLDLGKVPNQGASLPVSISRIASIEHVDLSGNGDNTLALGVKDVQDMAGMNRINSGTQAALGWTNGTFVFPARNRRHQLVVDGNAGDVLKLRHADSGWVNAGTVFHGGVQYTVYDSGTAGNQFERVEVIAADGVTTIVETQVQRR